ncbi:helix-turn-helix domain-containing protein [Corynebacterium propinquum]|nr:helix-turn-helix domain-containing protein [Corynebacterium propinquum]MDK4320424.1 helix-turn-helix domain-containing protein [Corynebacterium propinquum]
MAIPITLRKKIAEFDPIREGITVQQFCKNIGVSKQTYYNIKARIAERGRAGIVPDRTAPLNPRRVYDDKIRQQVLQARGTLKTRGQDFRPMVTLLLLPRRTRLRPTTVTSFNRTMVARGWRR